MVHVHKHALWLILGLLSQTGPLACSSGTAENDSRIEGTEAVVGGASAASATTSTVALGQGGSTTGSRGSQSTSDNAGSTPSSGGNDPSNTTASGGNVSNSAILPQGSTANGGARPDGSGVSGGSGSANGGSSSVDRGDSGGSSSNARGGRSNRGGTDSRGGATTGGKATGGSATGGKATGGSATGGKATGGSATGGTTADSTTIGPTVTCGCTTSAGEYSGNNIKQTIVVEKGQVFDGECMTFRADPSTLGPGDQSEDQKPVFRVNGGTLQNVILGKSAADGIHIYGDAVLKNVHWLDIGEDALTVKAAANLTIDCGSSNLGEDKTFQVNAASTITIRNFTAKNAGKFMRQNGDTTFKMSVTIDHCDISNMDECVYRTDSTTSTVTMTNTRYSNLGKGLFIFGSNVVNGGSSQSTVSNNKSY